MSLSSQVVRHSLGHPQSYERRALTFRSPGNSGIGYEISLQLALHGARVYITGRSVERLNAAIEQMKTSSEQTLDLHMLEMDQQSLNSVKNGAETFMKQESRLDILINNAGVRISYPTQVPLPANHNYVHWLTLLIADHGSPLQTHSRRLRNTMANESPRPLSAHQNTAPTPRIHGCFQRIQNPCPDRQRFS